MLDIILQILPIFLIMFLGGVFGYFNSSFNENLIKELNKYAYYIAFPSLIINSFLGIESIPKASLNLAVINVLILVIFVLAIIFLYGKIFKNKATQNTFFLCSFFGNIAYLGIPVVLAINKEYATSLSLHVIGYLLVIFTIGIAWLEMSKNEGKLDFAKLFNAVLTNPLLLSSFLGIILMTLEIKLPEMLAKSVRMISGSASPVVLFALGIFMVRNKLTATSLINAIKISMIKLFVLPLIFWLVGAFLLKNSGMKISIIMASMPVAITPFVLADIYDLDKKTVANAIIISTILAVLTIPLVVSLV